MSTMVMPVVGNKIKAVHIPGVTGTARDEQHKFTGQTVTITRIQNNSWRDDDGYHESQTTPYGIFTQDNDGTQEFWISKWEPVYEDTAASDAPAEPAVELTADQRTIADLKTTIADLQDLVRRLTNDIEEVIGGTLMQEAENRGWCETYDSVVESLNDRLAGCARLPIREHEFEVEVVVTGTISTTYTLSVTAPNQDYAESMVLDNPDDFFDPDEVLTDQARWESFDNIQIDLA